MTNLAVNVTVTNASPRMITLGNCKSRRRTPHTSQHSCRPRAFHSHPKDYYYILNCERFKNFLNVSFYQLNDGIVEIWGVRHLE